MNLQEAMSFLEDAERTELRDHAFGDVEVSWRKDGKEVAFGYLSGTSKRICVDAVHEFVGDDAISLMGSGKPVTIARNDETGPDDFVIGNIMPGLTKDSVLKEITNGRGV